MEWEMIRAIGGSVRSTGPIEVVRLVRRAGLSTLDLNGFPRLGFRRVVRYGESVGEKVAKVL